MSTTRKLIREAVRTRLENVVPDIGTRVFANRFSPTYRSDLPGLFVFMTSGTSEIQTVAPRSYIKEVALEIEIVIENRENLDDILDDYGELVAAAIAQDVTFNGCAAECDESGFEYRSWEQGHYKNAAALVLQYNLVYYQTRSEELAVNDWITGHAEYGENADGDPLAVDQFELEQP